MEEKWIREKNGLFLLFYLADEDSLCYRFNDTLGLTTQIKNLSGTLGEFLSSVNEIIKPYKDINIENGMLYIDTRDWGAVFDTISTVLEWANFVMRFASMNQDNSNAIKNYISYIKSDPSNGDMNMKAITKLDMFGDDFSKVSVEELLDCIDDEILEKATEETLKLAFKKLEIVKLAIKAVNTVAKQFGVDLADNSNYSILKEYEIKCSIESYCLSFPDDHFQNKKFLEEYRQAAILSLLSSKHFFDSANKLSDKYIGDPSYYDDRIDLISTVAGMFYLAVEGKGFDDFSGIDELIKNNYKFISNCNLICDFQVITEDVALKHVYKKSILYQEIDSDKHYWEDKAKDFIFNLPKYADLNEIMRSDLLSFELIDIDLDGSPEILMYSISSGGGGMSLDALGYFNGQEYEVCVLSNDSRHASNYIFPYFDSELETYAFISGLMPNDSFDCELSEGSYSSGGFWRGYWFQDFWEFTNGSLVISDTVHTDEIVGFEQLFNSSKYSYEERAEGFNSVKQHYILI